MARIDSSKDFTTSLRLPPDIAEFIQEQSEKYRRSFNSIMVEAAIDWVEKNKNKNQE